MSWPLPQDYNEAIQNPRTSFSDAELRSGGPVLNDLGIPIPCSGNFADVYEVRSPSGGRWAVKCFTRQVPGLRERYAAISRHLQAARLPFVVDFTFLQEGIRVRGRWYPVLKMQWVEGLTLNEFVGQYADKPAMLENLLQIWVRMAARLRGAGIAHADLQHGNILLVPGSTSNSLALRLVDYDGMFVPALAGSDSGEVGHPCYQHPRRSAERTYSAEVDRFPLLLIATALCALKVGGRALWDRYNTGDNLLFREADLRAPVKSPLFYELLKLADERAARLTRLTLDALKGRLESAPLLEEVLPELLAAPAFKPAAAPAPAKVTLVPVAVAQPVAEAEAGSVWDFEGEETPRSRRRRRKSSMPGWVWGMAAAGVTTLVLVGGIAALAFWPKAGQSNDARAAPKTPDHFEKTKNADKEKDSSTDNNTSKADGPEIKELQGTSGGHREEVAKAAPTSGPHRVSKPAYEATVEADGCLTSLLVGGTEFLWAGGTISRGTYLVQEGTVGALKLEKVERPSPDVITAQSGMASIRYEFGPDTLTYTVQNTSPGPLDFFMVFGPAVKVVTDGQGEWAKTPVARDWSRTTWFAGRARLHIEGSNNIRGPFEGPHQVWVAYLKPQEERKMALTVGIATDAEARRAAALIGANEDGGAVRAARGKPGGPLLNLTGHSDGVYHVTYSPDGKLLATASKDRTVKLWDAATGKEVRTLTGHNGQVYSIAFNRGGNLLASASEDRTVRMWHVASGELVRKFEGHAGNVFSSAFSPDGKLLASASNDKTVRLWDTADGKQLRELKGHSRRVYTVAFSPDGKLLASAGGTISVEDAKPGGEVMVWDVAAGGEPFTLPTAGLGALTVVFSRDGQRLAGACLDKTVRVWELATRREELKLTHAEYVYTVAFSPDGRRLASCSGQWDRGGGEVKVWGLPDGRALTSFKAHQAPTMSLAFSPDGTRLATASGKYQKEVEPGEVKVWSLAGLSRP